jgi:hypothetical protein
MAALLACANGAAESIVRRGWAGIDPVRCADTGEVSA